MLGEKRPLNEDIEVCGSSNAKRMAQWMWANCVLRSDPMEVISSGVLRTTAK